MFKIKLTASHYLLLSVLLLLLFYFIHPIPLQGTNVDLGHHLLLGEIITKSNDVPSTNIFAYTAPNFSYINTSWLSEVILYIWFSFFDFNGLIILAVACIGITFFLLCSNREVRGKYYAAAITGFVYIQILIDRTEVKPELFSLLFLSFFLFILYKNKHTPTKLIYVLPFMQLLWVNMHIFFIIGFVVIILFFFDALLKYKYNLLNKKMTPLWVVSVLSFVAVFINPQFIKGALYPLFVFQNYGYNVIENYNIFSAFQTNADITFLYFITAVLLLWIGIFIFKKKLKIIDILLAIFFTFLAFYAVRNFSLFVIGTFIPTVKIVHYLFEKVKEKYSEDIFQNIQIVIVLSIFIFITPGIIWAYSIHGSGMGVIDDAKGAVDLLKRNNITGPIYNNYNIGNYLEYRFYPEDRVFVNGSPEAYPKDFFQDVYYPIESSFTNFTKASKKYNFNVVIYDHVNQATIVNPLLTNIIKSKEWSLVYLNNRVVVYVKNIPKNEKFIKEYEISESTLQLKESDLNTKEKLMNLSNLFRVMGWYEKMYEMDLQYLEYDPNSCIALRHVLFYMTNTNHPLKNTYGQKYQQSCE